MAFEIYQGGRLPPHPLFARPRLWIDDFLTPVELHPAVADPSSRTEIDYFSKAGPFPMDLNGPDPSNPAGLEQGCGDCGIAGMDHIQMAWNAYAHGKGTSWGNDQVLSLYEYLSGYRRGDPATDVGTVLQDNLQFWRTHGIGTSKILFYGALRPGSWLRPERIKALQAFGGIYLGLSLPVSAEQAFPGDWVYVPRSPLAGGHCMVQLGELLGWHEARLAGWGAVVKASTGFLQHTIEEAWVIAAPDFIEVNGRNPSGLDIAGIQAAMKELTGELNPLGLKTIL